MRAREAQRLFDELNERYWHGRLPRYRVIFQAALYGGRLGFCDDKTRTILLLRSLNRKELRLTLLHEMCHIGTPSDEESHGPRFLRNLHRLMRLGEPKLLKDIELYDGTANEKEIAALQAGRTLISERTLGQVVLDDLNSLDLVPGSRPRWPKVRRWLAKQYRLAPSRLDRLVPWAEQEWRKLGHERRQDQHAQKALREGKMPPQVKD